MEFFTVQLRIWLAFLKIVTDLDQLKIPRILTLAHSVSWLEQFQHVLKQSRYSSFWFTCFQTLWASLFTGSTRLEELPSSLLNSFKAFHVRYIHNPSEPGSTLAVSLHIRNEMKTFTTCSSLSLVCITMRKSISFSARVVHSTSDLSSFLQSKSSKLL